jgi:cytochrome c553
MKTHSVLTAMLAGALTVAATGATAAGDPERGKKLAEPCMGCHGIPSYSNVYPSYRVPKLAGQHAEYLVAALQAYKKGERSHKTMQAQAASLSDQDMADIAAFFATHP